MIPYGRQSLDEDDIAAVVQALRSDWLTTGPEIEAFEKAFLGISGSSHAVAVSSGTAALHAAMFALDVKPGDEVIVPAFTFAATANCVVFQGATPVFCDVDPSTLLVSPAEVEAKITSRTRAILSVDYAGQPCDYDELRALADRNGLALVSDACHALGAAYKGRPVGSLADLSAFSFHPVKHMTTGEGGMVTTNDPDLALRMRSFRNHGIQTDLHQRAKAGTWQYEMTELGYNYRLTDIQCALGRSQLRKLPGWVERRREIAKRFDATFEGLAGVTPLQTKQERTHSYHLYVIQVDPRVADRGAVFSRLRASGVGANVHYMPVHLHPFYRERFATGPGLCPTAEAAYELVLSLPIFPGLTDGQVETVIEAVRNAVGGDSA